MNSALAAEGCFLLKTATFPQLLKPGIFGRTYFAATNSGAKSAKAKMSAPDAIATYCVPCAM